MSIAIGDCGFGLAMAMYLCSFDSASFTGSADYFAAFFLAPIPAHRALTGYVFR